MRMDGSVEEILLIAFGFVCLIRAVVNGVMRFIPKFPSNLRPKRAIRSVRSSYLLKKAYVQHACNR
jgi:hypothetical protein